MPSNTSAHRSAHQPLGVVLVRRALAAVAVGVVASMLLLIAVDNGHDLFGGTTTLHHTDMTEDDGEARDGTR
jgi:hypothetical protein